MEKFNFVIHGANSTGKFTALKSPYDSQLVAEVEQCDQAALEQALQNAKQGFESTMKQMPAYKRAEIIYKVAELIEANLEEHALTIAKEGGKPLTDARIEAKRAVNTTKMCADEALLLAGGETISMDRAAGSENQIAFTMRVPVGPVLCISAFNHPLNLACHQICPAIAAGNTVIMKPASQTPLSALKLADHFKQAGLPDGMLNVVNCRGSEAEYLLTDDRIRFVTFIGSGAVGWNIPKKIAAGVRYALEHGGTGTAIVNHDADLDSAIASLTKGAFYHAGQVCVSTQLIYAHDKLYDEVVTRMKASIEQLKTGDPTKAETEVGPIISHSELERIDNAVQAAINSGAKALLGAEKISDSCYAPTLLVDTNESMEVVAQEIFGPVVCIQRYNDLDKIIETMNSSNFSFQSAIYTRDINAALQCARRIDCMGFMINNTTAFRVDWMPFGGSKHSGLGLGGVKHSMHDMSEERLVVMKVDQAAHSNFRKD